MNFTLKGIFEILHYILINYNNIRFKVKSVMNDINLKKNKAKDKIPQSILNIFVNNKYYFITVLIIFIKIILFMAVIDSVGASSINLRRIITNIPVMPIHLTSIILLLSISLLFNNKLKFNILFILNILISVIIITDLCFYRSFSSYFNLFVFQMGSNTENLGSAVLAIFRPIDILFVIDIFLIILLKKRKKLDINIRKSNKLFAMLSILSFFYLSINFLNINKNFENFTGEKSFSNSMMPSDKMFYLGPIGYHIYDLYNFYSNVKPYEFSTNQLQEIDNWYKNNTEDLVDNKYKEMFKGKNLLVIQVESLENFVINKKVNGQEITPNINKMINNSLYFDNFHEQVWNGNSSDSDLLINTSIHPVREGSTFFRYPNNTYPHSLPNLMEGLGYSSIAIHPDSGSYWNYKEALTSIGFNKFVSAENLDTSEKIGLGISDKSYFKQAVNFIKEQKQPFYGFTVSLTSHTPFKLPKEYRGLKLDKDLDKSELGDYFQSVNYTDSAIGEFIEKLDKEGLLDNTVIVLYGDHTGVHKYFQDKIDQMESKELWYTDNENKIPLLIYNRGLKGETISTYGGQIDVLPTIAYLMGVNKENYKYAMGKNLLNTNKNNVILSDFKVKGEVTEEDIEHLYDSIRFSDKLIRGDYFKKISK